MLYISDPLAIQQVLTRDGEPYGLSDITRRCVLELALERRCER